MKKGVIIINNPSSDRSSKTKSVLSEINVTPFVDVMLVLLVIFMVTAPMLNQGIDVELPKTEPSGVAPKESPLVVSVSASGKIFFDKTEVSAQNVKQKAGQIVRNRKDVQVYLQADKKVPYGNVAELIAELRAAGIYNVGLMTEPKN